MRDVCTIQWNSIILRSLIYEISAYKKMIKKKRVSSTIIFDCSKIVDSSKRKRDQKRLYVFSTKLERIEKLYFITFFELEIIC